MPQPPDVLAQLDAMDRDVQALEAALNNTFTHVALVIGTARLEGGRELERLKNGGEASE